MSIIWSNPVGPHDDRAHEPHVHLEVGPGPAVVEVRPGLGCRELVAHRAAGRHADRGAGLEGQDAGLRGLRYGGRGDRVPREHEGDRHREHVRDLHGHEIPLGDDQRGARVLNRRRAVRQAPEEHGVALGGADVAARRREGEVRAVHPVDHSHHRGVRHCPPRGRGEEKQRQRPDRRFSAMSRFHSFLLSFAVIEGRPPPGRRPSPAWVRA